MRELAELAAHFGLESRGDLTGVTLTGITLSTTDLLPGDVDARDALSDALVEAGAYLEAIPLLRRRIDQTGGDERARLLRLLANVLEEHVGDEEGAFETWARLLDENPADLEAIAHMVAIDEQAGRHERLLSTLS